MNLLKVIDLFKIGLLLVIFSLTSFLIYQQIFSGAYPSDTSAHIIFLDKYFYGVEPFYIPDPLWHYGVYTIATILHISIEHSAILLSAFLVTFWVYLIYFVVKERLVFSNLYMPILITFSIIIIGPLCIPWYNKIIYLSQGSPNIWHNVTLWTVKPFALLSILFVFKAIYTKRNLYYFLTIIMVVVSLFAKPSFAIMFLPALVLFVLIKKLYNRQFIIFYILLGLISVFILLYQFTHTFTIGDSKMVFDFLGVWSQRSPNIAFSIVLAFPMLFLLLESKIIHDDYILLSCLQIFIGIIFYAFFAQTGKYYLHGNFSWSYLLAMSLLYLFSIVKYFELYKQMHKFKKYLLLSLLLIQVSIGIYYFVKVLQGQNPLYISIF